ncbi:MAG TPA: hypothetical protein VEZ90_05010, partial [Blastocatellia bacterium]|nr:hypothetical protein [Blastocatellia bacterium]
GTGNREQGTGNREQVRLGATIASRRATIESCGQNPWIPRISQSSLAATGMNRLADRALKYPATVARR